MKINKYAACTKAKAIGWHSVQNDENEEQKKTENKEYSHCTRIVYSWLFSARCADSWFSARSLSQILSRNTHFATLFFVSIKFFFLNKRQRHVTVLLVRLVRFQHFKAVIYVCNCWPMMTTNTGNCIDAHAAHMSCNQIIEENGVELWRVWSMIWIKDSWRAIMAYSFKWNWFYIEKGDNCEMF